jgi:hypothetical protein
MMMFALRIEDPLNISVDCKPPEAGFLFLLGVKHGLLGCINSSIPSSVG